MEVSILVRVADYIIKRIADEGAGHIFYVPGGQCVYLCDALRRSKEIIPVSCHHEQAAAMAAVGYGKYNNVLGACLVTTGCAGTNTMTGVLHAWQDSTPCIVVSGQQNYNMTVKESGLPLRQVGVQEADIETIVKPITKYAVTLSDASEVGYHMDMALFLAKHGRKGPVWIDVPMNIQNSMIDEKEIRHMTDADYKAVIGENTTEYYEGVDPDEETIKTVYNALAESKRPVILAGNGIRTGNAVDSFKEFTDYYEIPVVSSRLSSDVLEYADKLYYGVVSGLAGATRYANFIIQNSDLVLSIGSRLSLDTTGSEVDQFAREAQIIVVDIDKTEHSKHGAKIDRLILSDSGRFLENMVTYAKENEGIYNKIEWINTCNHWKETFPLYNKDAAFKNPIDSKYAMEVLSKKAPEKAVFISDAGFTGATTPTSVQIRNGQRMIHSFAQGEMGFSVPGAIGVAAASGEMVVAFTGDGSLMMNLQEFQTLVRNQYNVKVIVMNNNGYSGVRHGQKAHFRGKSIGVDPDTGVDFPDFGLLASAFGIGYYKVSSINELDKGINKCFENNTPFVLEIMTDPEQIDLHNGLVMYGNRKFGFRPIEDQAPYIDRELFYKEMIIKPLATSGGKPM